MGYKSIITINEIEKRIIIVRNCPVLMDEDLSEMYDVEIRELNQATI